MWLSPAEMKCHLAEYRLVACLYADRGYSTQLMACLLDEHTTSSVFITKVHLTHHCRHLDLPKNQTKWKKVIEFKHVLYKRGVTGPFHGNLVVL